MVSIEGSSIMPFAYLLQRFRAVDGRECVGAVAAFLQTTGDR
jgi:hypothetical protein